MANKRLPGNAAEGTRLRQWTEKSYDDAGRSHTSVEMWHGDEGSNTNHASAYRQIDHGKPAPGTPSWKSIDKSRTQGPQPRAWDQDKR